MSIIDKLLELDIKKLDRQSKEFEVKRLSGILQEKFIITCKPLSSNQVAHIGEISKNIGEIRVNSILEACRVEGKKFSDKELISKFNAVSGADVITKLFLAGEIYELHDTISKLSGYNGDVVEEVKN